MRPHELRSDGVLQAACARRCRACDRCRYVSFSARWEDCSWFFHCSVDTLATDVPGFSTVAVRGGDGAAARSHTADDAALVQELQHGTMVLRTGARMPRLGFGTASTDAGALLAALTAGYRLLDTAVYYRNEHVVRNALAASGVQRSEAFIVSKAWPFRAGQRGRQTSDVSGAELVAQVRRHVDALGVGALDLLLLHWPTDRLEEHWRALLALQASGVAQAVGLSNANVRHLDALAAAGLPPPALLQTELAPLRKDRRVDSADLDALVEYCDARGVQLMTHSPLRPALADARAVGLARAHNVSVAQLLLRYGLQRGFVVVFGSRSAAHMAANRRVLFGMELPGSALREIACWRREARCDELRGAVGLQSPLVARQLATREPFASEAADGPPPPRLERRPLWREQGWGVTRTAPPLWHSVWREQRGDGGSNCVHAPLCGASNGG
eukprot:5033217-Prymnesium_polylepis.1